MSNPTRGRRTSGPVPPLLLVVVGLVVAVVAGGLLAVQLMRDAPGTSSPPDPSVPTPAAQATAEPDPEATTTAVEQTEAPGPPTSDAAWISIGSAGLEDQPLTPEGLAADGTINPARGSVIWFTGNDRVQPGYPGTSVIAGHVTWEDSPDAFAQLPEVEVGDAVEVGYADGTTRSFTVTSASAVDKQELARSRTVWGEQPSTPRLAIITCDDAFGDPDDGHTAANFVVIAEG